MKTTAGSGRITLPLLLLGFKTYLEATGPGALRLAEIAKEVSLSTGISIVPIPQYSDIAPIVQGVGIPVLAQHIDPIEPGSHTGHILPEAIRKAGAVGTLINHSERRLTISETRRVVARAKEVGLLSCVCSHSPEHSARVAGFAPELILIESPGLIGTGRSISSVHPDMIVRAVSEVRKKDSEVHLICGAGISKSEDILAALDLGVVGVGTASAVIKAQHPAHVLKEMAKALDSGFSGKRKRVTLRSLASRGED